MARNRGYPAAVLLFLFAASASSAFRPPARLAVLDGAAFIPDFGPRWYMEPAPASPALAKRQGDGVSQCSEGQHSCYELGPNAALACCDNDQYCVWDTDWQASCCAIGSQCDLPCEQNLVYCNATSTSTSFLSTTATPGTAAGSPSVTLTGIPVETTSAGCCPRKCTGSSFQCQSTFGGQCCSNGASCAAGGGCLVGPTTAMSTIVPEIPPGCTASQITCTDGGGCCNFGSTCTWQQMQNTQTGVCAPNITVSDSGRDGSLSSGAKAGIAVGIVIGAVLVIVPLTWFCLRRRRAARTRTGGNSSAAAAAAAAAAGPGAVGMGYMRRGDEGDISSSIVRQLRRGPSETLSASTGMNSATYRDGLPNEYFGPDAMAGPYTEDANTPPAPALSPGGRVVPVQPLDPDDIVPPVEIDSRRRGLSIGSSEAERDMMVAGERRSRGARGGAGAASGRGPEPEPVELDASPPLSDDYFPRQATSPSPETGSRRSRRS